MTDENKELQATDLNQVSGGKINENGYRLLNDWIVGYKERGLSKEYLIAEIKDNWQYDTYLFKRLCTDGKDEDLQTAIDYIENHW